MRLKESIPFIVFTLMVLLVSCVKSPESDEAIIITDISIMLKYNF